MVNIASLGNPEIAAKIGKKGTVSDIELYNYKGREGDISFIHPHRYPERIQPLLYSLNLSHGALFVVDNIDRYFGEQVIGLDLREIKQGIFVLRHYIQPEQIAPFIKGTALENYRFTDDPIEIRERLTSIEIKKKEGETSIPVDHFFPVKGVGTVILGTVMSGEVSVHQELRIYPTDRTVQVRSIQVHDRDVNSAGVGSRVGLALKGIKPEELDRGIWLAEPGSMKTGNKFEIEPEFTPFWKGKLSEGTVLHLSSGTQFVPGKMLDQRTIELEKDIAYAEDDEILLIQADSMPRIIGKTELKVIE